MNQAIFRDFQIFHRSIVPAPPPASALRHRHRGAAAVPSAWSRPGTSGVDEHGDVASKYIYTKNHDFASKHIAKNQDLMGFIWIYS